MSQNDVRVLYLRDLELYHHEKPFILEDTTSYDKDVVTNVEKDDHPIDLVDIRGREDHFTYDTHSFRFIKHETAINFLTTQKQDSLAYINETMTILRAQFECERVICYDVRRRSSTESRKSAEFAKGIPENTFQEARQPAPPVYAVHIDHTIEGGYHRAKRHLNDEEIEKYIASGEWRMRIVNTWRPIKTIDASPLALCDYKTLSFSDLVETDLVSEDYVGETYSLKHNPDHRFYWLSKQEPDELCIFVVFDSIHNKPGSGVATCAHTAFDNPLTSPDAAPRESIEVRSIIFNRLKH